MMAESARDGTVTGMKSHLDNGARPNGVSGDLILDVSSLNTDTPP
jgi:hypothetical protein